MLKSNNTMSDSEAIRELKNARELLADFLEDGNKKVLVGPSHADPF